MRRLFVLSSVVAVALCCAQAAGARVLRVGTYHGIKGQYSSIQAAVNAAKPGDWILIGPGDYKTHSSKVPTFGHPATFTPAGVLITTPGLRIRGMNRNSVIVDGTKSGPPCNSIKADQNFGPKFKGGPAGLNGLMVWKTNNVWIQNLTACNFLGGNGSAGNEIWWNGGDDTGGFTKVSIGGWGFSGTYLTTTSTYYSPSAHPKKAEHTAAEYGIFSSNWSGGSWDHAYASNFDDSGFYIGACGRVCDQTVNHVWAEWNALGYSGSNSGGRLIIKNSQWDDNETGFSTNSQEGDNPPPQDGSCPKGVKPSVKGAPTCWVFIHNYVHDNNTPNVPTAGLAGGGPVGTGVSLAGSRNDTLMYNTIVHNGAWGISITPFPGSGPPCTGGLGGPSGQPACIWDSWGDAVLHNTFKDHNGFYGNHSNGDIAATSFSPVTPSGMPEPTSCFRGNKDKAGLSTSPPDAQKLYPKCNQPGPPNINPVFTEEVACDSTLTLPAAGKGPCLPGDHYPRANPKKIKNGLHPLPKNLHTMPHPCQGVPANPWCSHSTRHTTTHHHHRRHHRTASHHAHRRRGFTG